MNKLALLPLLVLLLSTTALSEKVAYVVRDIRYPNSVLYNILTAHNYTITLVDSSNAAGFDFTSFDLVLVGDETLVNAAAVPIRTMPSVVVSTRYLDTWGIAQSAGNVNIGNNYLKGTVLVNNTITQTTPSIFNVYNVYNENAAFLAPVPGRAMGIQNIVATSNDIYKSLIGIIEPGGQLYGGGFATTRTCYFGMIQTNYWSSYTSDLFFRCAEFAAHGLDKDRDGYPGLEDCNDNNPNINPGMTEIPFNGIDDDCNAQTRDNDFDLDGYCKAGTPVYSPDCPNEKGLVGTDCNDGNSTINPGVTDIPYNGVDENCDGHDLADVDHDGYCKLGYVIMNKTLQCPKETGSFGTDCNDNATAINPGAIDIPYDNIDQNCDGHDTGDVDQDGYCALNYQITNSTIQCPKDTGISGTDCNDSQALANPGQVEITYNGLDDDCNSQTIDNDLDKDGYCKMGTTVDKTICPLETGTIGTDCNDLDPSIHPGALDVPYDGIDENCDGADYADLDSDGYCSIGYVITNKALECPKENGNTGTDCNDKNSSINPGQAEIPYNGVNDDCNMATSDNDLDKDGYCKAGTTVDKTICPLETGSAGTDCNDTNPNVNPGVKEIYHNGVDDDCNLLTDDNDWTPPGKAKDLMLIEHNGQITISWSKPFGEVPANYNVYAGTKADSISLSQPIANTTDTTWVDLSPGSERYYIIRAEDAAANEENNTDIYGKFDVTLSSGYNLISLLLIPINNSLDSVFRNNVIEVLRYRNNKFENAYFDSNWKSDFGFNSVSINEGYFVKAASSRVLIFTGRLDRTARNIQLKQGMNLVGFSGQTASQISTIFSQSNVSEVDSFENDGYLIATKYPGQWYSTEGLTQIVPGKGYFVKANTDSAWSYTP